MNVKPLKIFRTMPKAAGNIRRLLALAGAVAVAAIAVTAVPAQAQFIEKDIRRGVTDSPLKLDPQFALLPSERAILHDLFIGLVTEDASGAIIPGAAESWEASRNGLTYTFQLRAGQKWSDGQLLEARDFVYGFQRLLAPRSGSPYASLFYNIEGAEVLHKGETDDVRKLGVKATTPRTVVFTLTERSPQFLSQLAHQAGFPLRRDLVEKVDRSWTRPGKMVSNGAYTLAEWLPGRYVRLARHLGFFDSAAIEIDNVYYNVIEDPEAGIERFFAGKLDIFSGLPRDRGAELMRSTPNVARMYPTLTVDYLVFNTKKPPLDDPRVREALALAIDSQTLVRKTLRGGEIPARGILPQGLANLREPAGPAREGPYPVARPYSPAEKREIAKELLDQAGQGAREAIRLTLRYNVGETNEMVAEAIADMWKKIGIQVTLYGGEYSVHYDDLAAGDFEVARAGWAADYDDPTAYLMLFQSTTERFNYGRFADGDFNKLMVQAARQDAQTRPVTLYRAAETAMKKYPVVPLYQHASRTLVGTRVRGWSQNIRDIHPSRFLSLTDEKPEPQAVPVAKPAPAPEPEPKPEPGPVIEVKPDPVPTPTPEPGLRQRKNL